MKKIALTIIAGLFLIQVYSQIKISYCDYSNFPEGDVITNCENLEAKYFDKNPSYKKSIRLLTESAFIYAEFDVIDKFEKIELSLEHLSSYSANARNNGYSPITILLNGKTVISNYSPINHGFTIEKFDLTNFAKVGKNSLKIIANKIESHYWLKRFDIYYYPIPIVYQKPQNDYISDVDLDIPNINTTNKYRFALIIGNEDYSSYQTGLSVESNVPFAIHDAEIFKEYMVKTFGIPNENIKLIKNGKTVELHRAFSSIYSTIENSNGKSEIFIYYAGHGYPDESTKEAYIIPVDVTAKDIQFAIKLSDVYSKLTEHPAKKIVVFLDACFSGGARNQSLQASRGVKIKPKTDILKGNIIIYSATSNEQSALAYNEKYHGLFTYYLLNKFKTSRGNLTHGELENYLKEQVGIKSSFIYGLEQNPAINVGYEIVNSYKALYINY